MDATTDSPSRHSNSSLETIIETEKKIKNYQTKIYNQHKLYNYWTEHPKLRLIPTAIIYIGGKLIGKL